jgi:hypothetical protein
VDINNYLIPLAGKDWRTLLSGWLGVLPRSFTLWLANRFGDLFVVYDDASVHMLDVGIGRIRRVADNRDHFMGLIDKGNNANEWLMIPLVDACVAAGMALSTNQCYGYRLPPVLGGHYDVANVHPTDLALHYAFLADLYRQTMSLADGTEVRVVFKN